MDEVQEGDDRGEERRLIEERTDATRKAHMRRRRRISELKKPANQKNHSGVVQRWADGDFQYFLVWFVVVYKTSSRSFFFLLFVFFFFSPKPGLRGGDKSLLFGVAKNDYRRFQQDLQAWWEKGWTRGGNKAERGERGREKERRHGKSQGHRRTRSAAINYTGQMMLSHY